MFQEKVGEMIKTRILHSVNFPENRAVYEMMWNIMVQPYNPQETT